MTAAYSAEQGANGMDRDVIPFLRREAGVNVVLSEFPYFQYDGPEDSERVREFMDLYGWTDVWAVPNHLRENGPYRTDVVAVAIDSERYQHRLETLGHGESMNNGEGWGKEQPRTRTFLNFLRDGAMTRDYYVNGHGYGGEATAYDARVSERAFQWLAEHDFLTPAPDAEDAATNGHRDDGPPYTVADIQPVIHGGVHAVELKREPGEWDTALEQAERASVYADYRHVVFSRPTAGRALDNLEAFRERGVGLMTVGPSEGVTVHAPAERCTPTVDHGLLSRPYCERMDLNERVVDRLDAEESDAAR